MEREFYVGGERAGGWVGGGNKGGWKNPEHGEKEKKERIKEFI